MPIIVDYCQVCLKSFLIKLQRAEQLTPYPQPRFYDPLSSRTFDRSQDPKSRSNSKRFHFGSQNSHHSSHGSNHGSNHGGHRENRLLGGGGHGGHGAGHGALHGDHGHHHQHHNEIIERIDEVIELVDCGGRDLGFCDMSSKYPGSDIIFQFSVKPIFRHSSE